MPFESQRQPNQQKPAAPARTPLTPAPAPPTLRAELTPADLFQLQRTIGNRAVSRLLQAGAVQRFPVGVEARGPAHNIRGGTSMTAHVGGESEWVYGSGPPGGVPNLMTKVRAFVQGKQRYIAGHLLNDNMGGQGVNDNLTVLSSNANKKHRGVEGQVKRLAQKADLINKGNANFGNPNYDHGVRYSVQVLPPAPAAKTPATPQEKYIGAGLLINIDPIRFNHAGAESPWPEEVGGPDDLTNHIVPNVPPYPILEPKVKPTPIQREIILAIADLKDPTGSTFKEIWDYVKANAKQTPQKGSVATALRRGVAKKFFFKRGSRFKVIVKNL